MSLDRFIARSQFVLAYSALFLLLVVIIIVALIIAGEVKADAGVMTLLATLGTGALALAKDAYSYFFQRQRPANADGVNDASPPDVRPAAPGGGPAGLPVSRTPES